MRQERIQAEIKNEHTQPRLEWSRVAGAKMVDNVYPGATASPRQLFELADEYRKAFLVLAAMGRPRKPLTQMPARLVAMHAIELYLSAALLDHGVPRAEVRGAQHDVGVRAEMAAASGLTLRKRTLEHLKSLTSGREYLVSRYGPELVSSMTQVNRLSSTLDEVARKVAIRIKASPVHAPSASK